MISFFSFLQQHKMVGTRKSTKRQAKQDDSTSTTKMTRHKKKVKIEPSIEIPQSDCGKNDQTSLGKEIENNNDQHFQTRITRRSNKGKEKAEGSVRDLDLMEMNMNDASFVESTAMDDMEGHDDDNDDDDDDDNIDWETIQLPPQFDMVENMRQDEEAVDKEHVYKDVEIVMESSVPRPVLK